jgi:transcriptional regulator with XRE-family HTH domain
MADMNAPPLRHAREQLDWTQMEAAHRLGVSQAYLSMLESGARRLTEKLARRVMSVYGMSPSVLPPSTALGNVHAQELAEQLAALGYPPLAYLRGRRHKKNPAEVLVSALSRDRLEARLLEALPWLVLRYPDMDATWLVEQARLKNLQNRLGYVVTLAQRASRNVKPFHHARTEFLAQLKLALEESKLAKEDTLCRVLSEAERRWLRKHRPDKAREWNLLTDLMPDIIYEQ